MCRFCHTWPLSASRIHVILPPVREGRILYTSYLLVSKRRGGRPPFFVPSKAQHREQITPPPANPPACTPPSRAKRPIPSAKREGANQTKNPPPAPGPAEQGRRAASLSGASYTTVLQMEESNKARKPRRDKPNRKNPTRQENPRGKNWFLCFSL